MKLLYICGEPSPYRVDFFNLLGAECELTAVFEKRADNSEKRNTLWYKNDYVNFKAYFSDDENNKLSVKDFVTDKSYDLIVVCNFYAKSGMAAIACMNMRRIPYGIAIDGGIPQKKHGIKELAKKYLIGNASFYLSSGKLPDEYLMLYGADKKNIYRYNFTSLFDKDIIKEPLDKIQKDALRASLCMRESKIIISVGQFIHRKGYDILLSACKDISKDTGVYIIGDEPTDEYIALKEKYALNNVHFVGFKQKAELMPYYAAADLFVLPTREDIWGLVINEAMSQGLAVITTENCVAGLELVSNGENGYIVKTDEAAVLAEKINLLLNDDTLLRKMSEKSLDKIKNHTIEYMVKQHISIFASLSFKRGKQ